jgi:DNA-binding response OmpR family regulator
MARVLVVDDNHDACELLARILRRSGHEAACQTTARGALAYLQSDRADLIILDVMMPEMTGLDLLGTIRTDRRMDEVPVIVYTALSDERTRGEAHRLGASGFVVKGTGWTELQAEIRRHLGPFPREVEVGVAPTAPDA